jgi:predicted RNA-binding Zn ribbon-like protein
MPEASSHDANQPAPGELWRVQRLINTLDLEDGRDDVATPDLLGPWLAEHELAAAGESFGVDDLERVHAFRAALRALLLSHNGEPVDRDAVSVLDAAAREATMVVGFAPDGTPRLAAAGGGVGGVFARLLAIIARAEADGTWARLKTCPADDCGWAFYDFSRNHSRTWCSMSVCGNRAKARTYRSRQPKASA